MKKDKKHTTIRVSDAVRAHLMKRGKKGESYDDVLRRLLKIKDEDIDR